ncbi:hypothetical protein MKK58_18745 [Methylobacterium sp. J-078]|uniref:hypothetical protein n=1 Tax=Methylobacterium sp. J-078 TaxID=2836657 RepID=UPI001FBB7501|nr:hypothetical protein [Methylobacterium sp. J-078]MCJ2046558.1 hypothetical protein [Methylobacterium sp. J-078]
MTHQAIDRRRTEVPLQEAGIRGRRTAVAAPPRWLRLGLAGVLGAVAGAVLFPTRAEGAPPDRAGKRRPGA